MGCWSLSSVKINVNLFLGSMVVLCGCVAGEGERQLSTHGERRSGGLSESRRVYPRAMTTCPRHRTGAREMVGGRGARR